MAQPAYAYDFERFETSIKKEKQQERQQPQLEVIKNPKAASRAAGAAFAVKTIAFSSLVMVVFALILYNNVVLSELTEDIHVARTGLSAMESDYQRLSSQLEGQISLRNIEEQVTQKMGMVKADNYQIEYVDLKRGDWIELTEASPEPSLLDKAKMVISRALEYIGVE